VIEVRNLTKRYGPRSAVENVSFRVKQGEIVGFLGPNGAGKSTTLRMLTGFLAPSGGGIRIGGIDMLDRPIEARKQIGYMPEACPLYPEMRVVEYLRYRAELKGVASRDMNKRVDTALAQASVTEVASRIIGQLSKGTKQRVGLADALVADPPLLVLDEPTAGLDPNQIRQVRELIRGFEGQKTVLLSTHILSEVEATCERLVIINKGRIVREGTPAELRQATLTKERWFVLRSKASREALEQALRALSGVRGFDDERSDVEDGITRLVVRAVDEADIAEQIFEGVAKAGLTLRELAPAKGASLEDVFTLLTKGETVLEEEDDDEDEDEDEDESKGERDESKGERESAGEEEEDEDEDDEEESGKGPTP
jgi:ABC-2 type transport system ATP-binding protein